MADEGYIKYRQQREPVALEPGIPWQQLNELRRDLFSRRLIGAYPDGVGYGNISQRISGDSFLITGSTTGVLPLLTLADYTLVTGIDIKSNTVTSRGLCPASSEALTHGIFYQLDDNIGAVIHVHHKVLWKELMFKTPTTDPEVPYGTPQMAKEITRLWSQSDLANHKTVVMGGHQDGIFTFGNTLKMANKVLLELLKKLE